MRILLAVTTSLILTQFLPCLAQGHQFGLPTPIHTSTWTPPTHHTNWQANETFGSGNASTSGSNGHHGQGNPSVPTINLDLSSNNQNMTASQIPHHMTVTIEVGGTSLTVDRHTPLTPAEYLAAMQVSRDGQQSLTLDAQGTAIGGSVVINHHLNPLVNGLVIPKGVTVIDLTNKSGVADPTGKITDNGNLYVTSLNPNLSTVTLQSRGIDVQPLGLLSNILPVGLLNGADTNLNLTITTAHNILNAGIISSAGSLDLNAGGSITNALPSNTTGLQPVIQAANNVNLTSGSGHFTNSGMIAATNGNINIASTAAKRDINIAGTGGTFQALNANINISDSSYAGPGNINLNGGDFLSQAFNLNSGSGNVSANVDNITGMVNVSSGKLNLNANAPNLNLGDLKVTGDPVIVNVGNVDIGTPTPTNGAAFVIIAGGNITDTNTASIDTSSNSGRGGNVVLIAGANNVTTDTSGNNTIINANTGSATGGSITLASSSNTTPTINTQSSANNGNGGNVTLIAFAGTTANTGQINVTNTGGQSAIQTNGNGTLANAGFNGNVTIIASAASASSSGGGTGYTITAGNILTGSIGTGGHGFSGSVTIETAAPNVATNPVIISGSNANQTGSGAIISGSFIGGTPVDGAISAANITTAGNNGADSNLSTSSGSVLLLAGSNAKSVGTPPAITIGAVTTTSASSVGGDVVLISGAAGILNSSHTFNVQVNSSITTGTAGFQGGSVLISTPKNFVASASITTFGGQVVINSGSNTLNGFAHLSGNVDTSSSIGAGGNVLVNAQTQINAVNIVTSSSAAGENGGSVVLSALSSNISISGSIVTTSTNAAAGNGGDVLITTGTTNNGIVLQTTTIDTSTASASHNAGQIWVILNSVSQQWSINIGNTQNQNGVAQAIPVTANRAPYSLGAGTTQIIFTPSSVLAGHLQTGSISGLPAGGFTSISDAGGSVDLKISVGGSGVQDTSLIVPINSHGAFLLTNSSTVEVPANSQSVPQLAFLDLGNSIQLGTTGHSISVTTNDGIPLPIAAIATTNGNATLTNNYVDQPISINNTLVNGSITLTLTGLTAVNSAQAAATQYSLSTSGLGVLIPGAIYAPQSITLISTRSGSFIETELAGGLSTNTLSLSSGSGGISNNSNGPVDTDAAFISVSTLTGGNVILTDSNSVLITGSVGGSLNFTSVIPVGVIQLGAGASSLTSNGNMTVTMTSSGVIDIEGNVTASGANSTMSLIAGILPDYPNAITENAFGLGTGTLTANSIVLLTGAQMLSPGIGTSGNEILTATSNLAVVTTGEAEISNIGNVSLSAAGVGCFSNGEFNLDNVGTITIPQTLTVGAIGSASARIDFYSTGTITINTGATVQASSSFALRDELIQFTTLVVNAPLTVINNGTIQASGQGPEGIIGFNGGATGTVTLSGTGSVFADTYVGFGNLNSLTLAVTNPAIVPTALSDNFSTSLISVHQGSVILNQVQATNYVAPTPPNPPSPIPTPIPSPVPHGGSFGGAATQVSSSTVSPNSSILSPASLLAFLFTFPPNNQSKINEQIGTRIAIDYTPLISPEIGRHLDQDLPGQWQRLHPEPLQDIKTLPLQGHADVTHHNYDAGQAQFAASTFNANELTALANQGIVFGPSSKDNFFDLVKGFVLFMPTNNISVQTREGIVHIPKGAHAWIMETGADAAIYDLHDSVFTGSVKVTANNKELTLSPGTEVLLTRNPTASFDELNPGNTIGYRNIRSADLGQGIKAFVCNFSIAHGLNNVPMIHNLLESKNPTERKAAWKMIKNAAILADVTGDTGYKTQQ